MTVTLAPAASSNRQTRGRGSTMDIDRRARRTRADARRTRMRVSSDSVVSAYVQELAKSTPPSMPVTKDGPRLAGRAAGARIGGKALEPARTLEPARALEPA
jgi:hypothetical protein